MRAAGHPRDEAIARINSRRNQFPGLRHHVMRAAMRRPVLGIDFTRFHTQGIEVFSLPPELAGRN